MGRALRSPQGQRNFADEPHAHPTAELAANYFFQNGSLYRRGRAKALAWPNCEVCKAGHIRYEAIFSPWPQPYQELNCATLYR